MTDLENRIKYYADKYYLGETEISDSEYDALIEELKRTNPKSELLHGVVGTDLKGIIKTYKIPYITMGTLEKIHKEDEFKKWYNDNINEELIAELKCDGCSAMLEYRDGKLIRVYSRGNGEYGKDITSNVSKVKGVIKNIPNFTGGIRGEILLFDSVFNLKFKNDFSNARNAAAGIINRLDGSNCEDLNFVAYEVNSLNNDVDSTELDKINFLKENGFQVPLWWAGCNCEDIIEFRNNIDNYRKDVDYGIDGIVVKFNKVNKEDLKRHTPTTQIAFKPEATTAISILRDIEWQLAGSILSPVAVFDPVEIDGAVINKATLHNLNKMEELGIRIGKRIEIIRSGMVIPKIVKVLED